MSPGFIEECLFRWHSFGSIHLLQWVVPSSGCFSITQYCVVPSIVEQLQFSQSPSNALTITFNWFNAKLSFLLLHTCSKVLCLPFDHKKTSDNVTIQSLFGIF